MAILKLKPSGKDYLWGGKRLIEEYGKEFGRDTLAETWELSCHPDGPSYIVNGEYAGKTLAEYIDVKGKSVLGNNCRRFRDFPILIKFIDAKDSLSIQVHPDNQYALKNEGQYGKTEVWYVMDAGEDAFLYYGFSKEISKEEFAARIEENTLTEVLNKVSVQKGDILFIEAGTIHAIGKDILIAEIQQNSNITYRVYDYGRIGKDGKKRDLHIEKALAVTTRVPIKRTRPKNSHIADCDYFTVDKLILDGNIMKKMEGYISEESFASILILEGQGYISCDNEKFAYEKGDSFFLSAGCGNYEISGCCEALITRIREKSAPIRIGVDIGGSNVRIGLLDVHQKLVASKTIPTDISKTAQEVITRIGNEILELLEQEGILVDQCVSVGIGVPGTIDTKKGKVLYSNNIEWKNVDLKEVLQKILPLPIYVGNNADCAVWGEVTGGAARGYDDVLMLKLGVGVGGGVVLNGKIYNGKMKGGSELGHMVIVEDGELCSCGRKGCLEAYLSRKGLLREAQNTMKKYSQSLMWDKCGKKIENLQPEHVFQAAKEKDAAAVCVMDSYKKLLGTGLTNLVNIFRPQLVLLGGNMMPLEEDDLCAIRDNLVKNCFGGDVGDLPELEIATLGNLAGVIGAANLAQ